MNHQVGDLVTRDGTDLHVVIGIIADLSPSCDVGGRRQSEFFDIFDVREGATT